MPTQQRLHKRYIPSVQTQCGLKNCVYNDSDYCDDPRVNHGNSDSICHKYGTKKLLKLLGKII